MKQTIAVLAGLFLAVGTGCSGSSTGSSSSGSTGKTTAGTSATTSTGTTTTSTSSGSTGHASSSGSSGSTAGSSSGSGSTGGSSSGSTSASGSTGGSGSGSSGSTGAPIPGTPITVISIEDFHPARDDGGEQFVPETEPAPGRFSALVPQADGGYAVLPDLGLDGGYDTIPGGPDAGTFFVRQFGNQATETASHTVNWSQDFLGKATYGVVNPATDGGVSTPVTFNLTGFPPFGSNDLIEFSALHDDSFEDYSLQNAVSLADGGSFTVGETAVQGTLDWATYAGNGSADGQAPTVDPGDPLFAAKFAFADAGNGGQDTISTIDAFVDLTGQSIADGVPATISGTAVAQTASKSFVTLVQRPSAFENQLPPGSQYAGLFFDLGAMPQAQNVGLINTYIVNDLAYGSMSAGTTPAPQSLSFSYANPYPASWDEVYYFARSYKMPITVSASPGGVYNEFNNFISAGLKSALPATQSPGVGPVQALQVNGQSADTNLGPVGLTPTISWTAPTASSVTAYRVHLVDLVYDATAQKVAPAGRGRFYLLPTTTSFTLPPGRFRPGHTYIVEVTAISQPGSDFSTKPAHQSLPFEWATVSTHLLTP